MESVGLLRRISLEVSCSLLSGDTARYAHVVRSSKHRVRARHWASASQYGPSIYTLSNASVPKGKWVLPCKYFRYLHKITTIIFTLISTTRQAKCHVPIITIGGVSLLVCIISSLQVAHTMRHV